MSRIKSIKEWVDSPEKPSCRVIVGKTHRFAGGTSWVRFTKNDIPLSTIQYASLHIISDRNIYYDGVLVVCAGGRVPFMQPPYPNDDYILGDVLIDLNTEFTPPFNPKLLTPEFVLTAIFISSKEEESMKEPLAEKIDILTAQFLEEIEKYK